MLPHSIRLRCLSKEVRRGVAAKPATVPRGTCTWAEAVSFDACVEEGTSSVVTGIVLSVWGAEVREEFWLYGLIFESKAVKMGVTCETV